MSENCNRRSSCRLCGAKDLSLVLKLRPTPPANAFVRREQLEEVQECFPLDLFFCEDCAHLQLLDVVDPRLLFENYVYVSGTSPVFQRHFQEYANYVIQHFAPPAGSLVVDIGSNDGTLLRFFKEAGYLALGIDPAQNIAHAAAQTGIETICDFFTPQLAHSIRQEHGAVSVVTANNVFAHIDDLSGVVEGVRRLLAPHGIFIFEVSYLGDVYEKTLFDTIYHEHLAYHSVKPLASFLASNGMELVDALRVDSHGGSLRGVAQLQGGPKKTGASVAEMIRFEEELGLDQAETFRVFAQHIEERKQELIQFLGRLKSEGKRIAGFGAPAKATPLMYHFGIGPEIIDFIVDDSPLKQGMFTPGMHIPVLPSQAIYDEKPDYVVLLAWNFAESIMAKHTRYRDGGGRFIIPLPKVEVY